MKNKTIKNTFLLISICCALIGCKTNKTGIAFKEKPSTNEKEILLIGTFHFNNPGADVAKTKSFNILSPKAQKELDEIVSKIKEFKPSKIFVEWENDEQAQLDSLYHLYRNDNYFKEGQSKFYKEGEIFQLAFRAANACNHSEVYGIDVEASFPYDSVMTVIAEANQMEIKTKLGEVIQKLVTEFDDMIEGEESLAELLYYLNRKEIRELDNELQIETMMLVGDRNNFIGPYMASEWIRRNLYMWSIIQKLSKEEERVMVLLGSSHIAVIKEFIDKNQSWNSVELKTIMN